MDTVVATSWLVLVGYWLRHMIPGGSLVLWELQSGGSLIRHMIATSGSCSLCWCWELQPVLVLVGH